MASMNKPSLDNTNWYQAVTDNWTAIESSLIDNTILTTKGDLFAASAASTPVCLSVGTDGQVLTADSGSSAGLAWSSINSAATIFTRRVRATSSTSTTSGSMTDLDSMTLTVNVTGSQKVLVIFNATVTNGAAFTAQRILRDNVEIRAIDPVSSANPFSLDASLVTLDQPGSGTHTYKIQWRTSSGTMSQNLQPYSSVGDRELILVVLPG